MMSPYACCLVGVVCVIILSLGLIYMYTRLKRVTRYCTLFGADNFRYVGYVIHLPDRSDRHDNLRRLLRNAEEGGVKLSVIDAVDARSCKTYDVPAFLDYSHRGGRWRTHLRGGEQGCLASHLKILKLHRKSYADAACFIWKTML